MDEQEATVWIDSPEEVEQMPDEVRKVLEEMDSNALARDLRMAA
jgi:hypothetical protein